jgi:hypothetical protein
MQAGEGLSLEQIRAFLNASDEVGFKARDRGDVYAWLSQTLRNDSSFVGSYKKGSAGQILVGF